MYEIRDYSRDIGRGERNLRHFLKQSLGYFAHSSVCARSSPPSVNRASFKPFPHSFALNAGM